MRFTIKLKLGLAFAAVIALLIAATAMGISSLSKANRESEAMWLTSSRLMVLLSAMCNPFTAMPAGAVSAQRAG